MLLLFFGRSSKKIYSVLGKTLSKLNTNSLISYGKPEELLVILFIPSLLPWNSRIVKTAPYHRLVVCQTYVLTNKLNVIDFDYWNAATGFS